MFTGIIESLGKVSKINFQGNRADLYIENPLNFDDVKTGSSVCVNGSCLTVLEKITYTDKEFYRFDVSEETLEKTTFKTLKSGESVNLERSLTLSGRLDGHLVLGHVDTTVKIRSISTKNSGDKIVEFGFDENFKTYFIEKGSVAINGISLTIFDVTDYSFKCVVLPFTWDNTNLKNLKEGDRLNMETDVIGKYVKKFSVTDERKKSIDFEFLREHGF